MYFCEKCNKHVLNVSPKYRIKVRVIDSTDSAIFVIFDRDGVELFNMACAEMIHSVGLDENSSRIPKSILDLVDKTYLFKVETNISEETRYEKSYRVNRMTANAEVVAMFNAKYSIYEVNNAGDEVSNGNDVDVDAKENDSTADLFAQAQKIQTTIGRELGAKFANVLRENNVYVMYNFKVELNELEVRTNTHKYILNFTNDTKVKCVHNGFLPIYSYFFTHPNVFLNHKYNPAVLVDVIGMLTNVAVENDYLIDGEMKKIVSMLLLTNAD
ncbi:hypothetical protein P8452_15548 [Trifolium repens]|nr:hypothetical protein P8452_15548 [Trifolium repens]